MAPLGSEPSTAPKLRCSYASDSGKKFDRAVLGHAVVAARSAQTNRPGPGVHTSARTVSSLSCNSKERVG